MTDSESERERLRVKERVREIVGMCQVLECVIVGKCERERENICSLGKRGREMKERKRERDRGSKREGEKGVQMSLSTLVPNGGFKGDDFGLEASSI